VTRFAELSLALDRGTLRGKKGAYRRGLLRGRLKGRQRPLPPLRHQMRQTEGQPFLVCRPGGQIEVGFYLCDPAVPGWSTLGVPQPALQELHVVLTQHQWWQAIRTGEVNGLAIPQVCLSECQDFNERTHPSTGSSMGAWKP
jgi:hypothetical protein